MSAEFVKHLLDHINSNNILYNIINFNLLF